MEVAHIHDAVVATDPLLVQPEVFFGWRFRKCTSTSLASCLMARSSSRVISRVVSSRSKIGFQTGLPRPHVAAGVQDHVAAGDQPVGPLALVQGIDLDAVVTQGRIAADFALPHARPDRLAEHPGSSSTSRSVSTLTGIREIHSPTSSRSRGPNPQERACPSRCSQWAGYRAGTPRRGGRPCPLCRWHGVARFSRKFTRCHETWWGPGADPAHSTRSAIPVPSGFFLRRFRQSSEREPRVSDNRDPGRLEGWVRSV